MKRKKILLAVLGAFSIFTLAACSGGDTDLVTMKGGKITVEQFFNDIKTNETTKQELAYAIIYKVASDNYGDKVTKEDVNKEYDNYKDQLGDQFDMALQQQGMTEEEFKKTIKNNLAYKAMIEAHVDVTDEDLEKAWETFHPEVTASVIYATTKEEADALLKEIDGGADFIELAKANPTGLEEDESGELKFGSDNASLPDEVKTDAFKLKDGEVSGVITSSIDSYYGTVEGFYIVKMIKNQDKGTDMNKYKSELEEIIKNEKLNDPVFSQQVLSDELNKADIKIKDDALKDILAAYMMPDETTASTDEVVDEVIEEEVVIESSTAESSTADTQDSNDKTAETSSSN